MQVHSLGLEDPHGNPLQYSCLENSMLSVRLQSIGSHRVGYDWSDLACVCVLCICIYIYVCVCVCVCLICYFERQSDLLLGVKKLEFKKKNFCFLGRNALNSYSSILHSRAHWRCYIDLDFQCASHFVRSTGANISYTTNSVWRNYLRCSNFSAFLFHWPSQQKLQLTEWRLFKWNATCF